MACVCFLPDCPQCQGQGHRLDDGWRLDGKYVTRIHRRPRYHLFTPTGVAAEGIPVPVEKLLNHRTTKIVKLGSSSSSSMSQFDEDWRDSAATSSLSFLWVGESIFEVVEEHFLAGAKRHHCTQLKEDSGIVKCQAACFCFLPDCRDCCGSRGRNNSSTGTIGSGNSMPTRGLRIIAAAHDELQAMLKQDGGWLSRGKGWRTINTKSHHHASRLEEVVARLCRCSVSLVQKARACRRNILVEPKVRGRKRKRPEHTTSLDGEK